MTVNGVTQTCGLNDVINGCSETLPCGPINEAKGLGDIRVHAWYFISAPDSPGYNPDLGSISPTCLRAPFYAQRSHKRTKTVNQ